MAFARRWYPCVAVGAVLTASAAAQGQTFRVSFDDGVRAERAAGRAEPWLAKGVERVAGKFGQAARLGPGASLIYAGEQNVLAGRGTLACWCKVPQRPGPLDIQRLVYVQSKERGYWHYLISLEWQEGPFRAMVFDFYHGHGWHDPEALPGFTADTWHHLALAWDQAQGTRFYLDGRLAGSTWGQQAWWDRPTPHAIHLAYPGGCYDELCIYDRPLGDAEVAALFRDNRWPSDEPAASEQPLALEAAARLAASTRPSGIEQLPVIDPGASPPGTETVIRQARVRQVLDDRIPSWKVLDGRMDLFWPEWRSPTLGDVDFSGSELHVSLEPGQKLTHVVLRGLLSGCRLHGERAGYVSRQPILEVPSGLHFLAAGRLPPDLTGLRVPRRDSMKLQEIGLFALEHHPPANPKPAAVSLITGDLNLDALGSLAAQVRTRTLPEERRLFGQTAAKGLPRTPLSGLARVHFVTEPLAEALPLDAVHLSIPFVAAWKEDIWWLRVQDPVNPRRDLIHVPLRVRNPTPGQEAVFAVTLDFWDILLDAGSRLWLELLPTRDFTLAGGPGRIELRAADRARAVAEFGHTQSQLAFSYWQIGSEAEGRQGSNPDNPSFNLLGGISHNYELRLTLEWIRRHVPDQPLANNLWRITQEKRLPAPVQPRLKPEGAPEWAVWGRELLERFRTMSHAWADWQGPDGQLGGGWNDDTDFPGVFICLPLLGDTRTQQMFTRVYDGLEQTGYLQRGVSRAPIDTRHAADFLSWRGHLILFDYGQPRHVERALDLTRELFRWTRLDAQGHRRGLTNHYSEDGPARQPGSKINDDGSIEQLRDLGDYSITPLLMDTMFCAWYARNPAVLKFVREVAEGELARSTAKSREGYVFTSFAQLFSDEKFARPALDQYQLTAAEEARLVQGLRSACEVLAGGWQFRGGEARGANDHFSVPGQTELSRLYLGFGMTWLRPATMMIPPIHVSWQGLDDQVAVRVGEATPRRLRLAAYSFDSRPRTVRMRVWRLEAGRYRLRTGVDADRDGKIDAPAAERDLDLIRSSPVDLDLPPAKVFLVELNQLEARPRPELLPDLAVGEGDIDYDKATDRLKVIVHNLGAAAARDVLVHFETEDGKLLARRTIPQLDAPLDLVPKSTVVWMPNPTLLPLARIVVRIDPQQKIEEITRENNEIAWIR